MSIIGFWVALVLRTYSEQVTIATIENEYDVKINSLYTSNHIKPVYEPRDYDLVYLKNDIVGQLIGENVYIYGRHSTLSIKLSESNVRMFGRVTTKKSITENIHVHYGHYSKYKEVRTIIKDASIEYQVPYDILATLIYNESKFDNNAVSHTGVRGIAMFTTATAEEYGVDRHDVVSQIHGMARKLQHDFLNTNQTWSIEDRWKITAYIYNSGKKDYWKIKGKIRLENKETSYKNIIDGLSKIKRKEGIEYIYKLQNNIHMFS